MALTYDYTKARAYCTQHGLVFHDSWVPSADTHFAAARLSQSQVDAVLELHAWHVAHLFKPSQYTWRQRIAIAWFFLTKGSR